MRSFKGGVGEGMDLLRNFMQSLSRAVKPAYCFVCLQEQVLCVLSSFSGKQTSLSGLLS